MASGLSILGLDAIYVGYHKSLLAACWVAEGGLLHRERTITNLMINDRFSGVQQGSLRYIFF